mgnify:CR=1 FL=1
MMASAASCVSSSATAAEKFREATEAYEVLKDPEQRRQYDRFGHQPEGGGFGGFGAGKARLSRDCRPNSAIRFFQRFLRGQPLLPTGFNGRSW